MHYAPANEPNEAEKKIVLDKLLRFPGGYDDAIQYVDHVGCTPAPIGICLLGIFSFQH
jgi:hypothetical protein